ncbi:hypothetical protein JCM10599A_03990 [Paraburkholderia kururiensis]
MVFRVSRFDDSVFEINSVFVEVARLDNEIGDFRLAHPTALDLNVEVERKQFCLLEILRAEGLPELYLFEGSLKRFRDDDSQIVGAVAVAL